MAVFENTEGKKVKTTHFGQRGASDYTKHGDKERMERYLERHGGGFETSTKEDWKDPTTAGALSRWILWNKPSLSASFADYKKRFGLKGSLTVSKSAEGLEVKKEQKFVLKNPQDYDDMMDEIRPQLEAHKIPWKLWYLEKKFKGVEGKTWKREGVYPVVIIKPNEMELKMPNAFTKYLQKQKGGMYHRISGISSGNPYKHLIFKGNHIYGGDEDLGYEGKGVAWFDPKIDRNRFETLEIESWENSRLGLGKMRGVWKGSPQTPRKKDMILPPQFKKMMEDVGFSDFITKMEMGSELRLKPIWRLKDAPIGVVVDIPLEMGGNYIAKNATLMEVKPADKSTVKKYLKKPLEHLSNYPNDEKAKKQVEKAKNGELLSVTFNVSHLTNGIKKRLADYIQEEDYFVTAGFPEQILETSHLTLKYSPEADKYYTEGQPEPYLDTTSQMLKDLGLDYQAEWAKPPKQISRFSWKRPTPSQKQEADIIAAEVQPISFDDLHDDLLNHKRKTGERPIEWFNTKQKRKDWWEQYDFIKFLDDAGYEWSPNIIAVQENECKGVLEYQDYTFFLYQTEYLRWSSKRNDYDWTETPTANTKCWWVAVGKFDKRSGEYDFIRAIFPNNSFRQGDVRWERTIDIEYTKKSEMEPLVKKWINENLYRPRVSTDMVEDLMVSQGQYIHPIFHISEMTLPQATEPQKVMFYYDYQEGKVHALLKNTVGKFFFLLDNYLPSNSAGIFSLNSPIINDRLLLPYLVAGVLMQYPVPFTEETMKEINKSPIHWVNKTTEWSERELSEREVEETALIQEMVDLVEMEPRITNKEAWIEHLDFDYEETDEDYKDRAWVRKWPFNDYTIRGYNLPRNNVQRFEAKSPAQKSLDKWTKEDWGTKSGKPSTQGSQATGERYLPRKAREALTDKEYQETSDKKRRDTAKGMQFSQQPDDIEEKTAKYRSETFEAIEGTGSNARFTDQPDPKIYRDPSLRQKARNKLLKGDKGGDEGQWSARKAQMSATEYRKLYENKYGEGKNPYF